MGKRFLSLVALILPVLSFSVSANNYSVGTGGQSGIYYPFGGALAKVWSDNIEGISVKAEVTAASVENTIKVVRGDMLAGLAMGNVVLDAYKGEGKFPAKMPVNVLFALYPNLVHAVTTAKTDIKSLSDLNGKRVSLGAPGSGTAVTSAALLESLEVAVNAVHLNFSETTNALANGQIDAGFIVGGQGVGAVTQLALTHDIRLLDVSEQEQATFRSRYPAYSSYTIPEGIYNKVGAVNTLSVWNVLVVKADLPEDMAYELTRTAFENIDQVRKVVKAANATTLANAGSLNGVPLHSGAARYFKTVQ